MGICVANAHAENGVPINHRHDFVMGCDERLTLSRQDGQDVTAVAKAAKCQFANHSGMAEEKIVFNNPAQLTIGMPKMINPD